MKRRAILNETWKNYRQVLLFDLRVKSESGIKAL